MKNIWSKYLIIFCFFLFFSALLVSAEETKGYLIGNNVRLRSSAEVTNSNIITSLSSGTAVTLISSDKITGYGCSAGWYQVKYGSSTGYICSSYISFSQSSSSKDAYGRPWTSPKAAIMGGAKFISQAYISKGQFTSYLKKFNVNPNGSYNVYNHQYMANLQAPYSEAYTSYKSYRDNNLLTLPLEFTIPVFNSMPDYTTLPGKATDTSCQAEVTDIDFEAQLNAQNFPESYKCKLRILHNTYANWTFKTLNTNLDFSKSVTAEQAVSSIQGNDAYYDYSSGNKVQTEPGWYKANYDTAAYFLDPRNFLNAERILMFEKLASSENYTESVVQSILKGTFMAEYSLLDNQSYASIFVDAGKTANVSSVYLASLAKQEVGNNGSKATSGAEFTYQGITYTGLFNFFNIGANSSAEVPVYAGLVWASGGSDAVIVGSGSNTTAAENDILEKIGAIKKSNCLTNLNLSTKVSDIKTNLAGLTVNISGAKDTDILKTGQTITISDGTNNYTYIIVIKGDVDGDGNIGATDYVKIKNYIMEKKGSELSTAQSIAADADGNNAIGATDYVKIKNSIMGR